MPWSSRQMQFLLILKIGAPRQTSWSSSQSYCIEESNQAENGMRKCYLWKYWPAAPKPGILTAISWNFQNIRMQFWLISKSDAPKQTQCSSTTKDSNQAKHKRLQSIEVLTDQGPKILGHSSPFCSPGLLVARSWWQDWHFGGSAWGPRSKGIAWWNAPVYQCLEIRQCLDLGPWNLGHLGLGKLSDQSWLLPHHHLPQSWQGGHGLILIIMARLVSGSGVKKADL